MSSSSSNKRAPFPRDQAEFPSDSRISFSISAETYVLRDEAGKTWEWVAQVQNWTEAIDEAQIAQQSKVYNDASQSDRKRKASEEDQNQTGTKPKAEQAKPDRAPTAVYVSSLPQDTTEDEIHDVFKRFGVLAESLESNKPRIKLYHDDDGNFKGEALVVYHRPESVPNAVLLLDGTDLRLEEPQKIKMSVKIADSSYKRQKDDQSTAPLPPGARRPINRAAEQNKKKAKLKYAEMNSRLGDWSSDEEPQTAPPISKSSAKTLVLKSMFNTVTIKEHPEEILEIKEDIREECEKLGTVTNVVLYDQETDGVVTVRFSSAEAAAVAAEKFNGRKFDGQTVVAYVSDGREKFRKSGKDEDAVAERERLDRLAGNVASAQ